MPDYDSCDRSMSEITLQIKGFLLLNVCHNSKAISYFLLLFYIRVYLYLFAVHLKLLSLTYPLLRLLIGW